MGMICEVSAVPSSDRDRVLAEKFRARQRGLDPTVSVSLEKSWHGVHYLLTGTAFEGNGPLGFIASGGEEIPGSDMGYGPARLFSADEVAEINAAMSEIDDDDFWSRFDAEEMTEQTIYPDCWDEPEEELKEEYLTYFHELKKLLAAAAARGDSLRVAIT
jgi:hypothetical protein